MIRQARTGDRAEGEGDRSWAPAAGLGVGCFIFVGPHKWCPRCPWGGQGPWWPGTRTWVSSRSTVHVAGGPGASPGLQFLSLFSQVMTAALSQACHDSGMAPRRPHSCVHVCICVFWGGIHSKHFQVPAGPPAMPLLSGASQHLQGGGLPRSDPSRAAGTSESSQLLPLPRGPENSSGPTPPECGAARSPAGP